MQEETGKESEECSELVGKPYLPAIGHEPKFVGRLGKELDANAGREAVRIAALNVLSAARQKLGSLDKVTRVVRLCIYLATYGDFFDQPKVADAASTYSAMFLEETKPQSAWC